jgi:hypothetical protein
MIGNEILSDFFITLVLRFPQDSCLHADFAGQKQYLIQMHGNHR